LRHRAGALQCDVGLECLHFFAIDANSHEPVILRGSQDLELLAPGQLERGLTIVYLSKRHEIAAEFLAHGGKSSLFRILTRMSTYY